MAAKTSVGFAIICALLTSACANKHDDDVSYFVRHANSGEKDWLGTLSQQRQIDMFFASHKTRPSSAEVALWMIRKREVSLVSPIRAELDKYGTEYDIDSYLLVVGALAEHGNLTDNDVSALRLEPLCEKVRSDESICRKNG